MISKHYTVALILLVAPLLVAFGSAVECGSTPTDGCTITQNTTFNTGTYALPSGINFNANAIILDCNGSTLSGNGSSAGIEGFGRDNLVIKNCRLESYGVGLDFDDIGSCPSSINPTVSSKFVNNTVYNSTYGIWLSGASCDAGGEFYANNNHLINNYFLANARGAFISGTTNLNATQNTFVNNSIHGLHLATEAYDSIVYNNSFYNTSIRYDQTNNNKYCLNNQYPNSYFNGAIGPPCGCILPQNSFTVTSNETLCQNSYNLTSGFFLGDFGRLDCNNSILIGNGSGSGIRTRDAHHSTASNCVIQNYSEGVTMDWDGTCSFSLTSSHHNSFINNTIRNNLYGIHLDGIFCFSGFAFGLHSVHSNQIVGNDIYNNTRGITADNTALNNITLNDFHDNVDGVYLTSQDVVNNTFYQNNFYQNNASAQVFEGGNKWNITGQGNYWSDYDSAGEGCNNANFDQFCDLPYNTSGGNLTDFFPYVVQDGWLLGVQASQPLPVQVIADVDMVKDKTTLIRIPVTFTSVLANDTITPNVTVYWNSTFVGQNLTTTFTYNETKNVDFWYVPSTAGSNIQISTIVRGTSVNGINYSDTNSKTIDVVSTRSISVTFIPIDNKTLTFKNTLNSNAEFINKTYPLSDNGLIISSSDEVFDASFIGQTLDNMEQHRLLKRVFKQAQISNPSIDRAVGVVPSGWFFQHNLSIGGYAIAGLFFTQKAVIIEEGSRHLAGHELGHTYGLCDEYDSTEWDEQDSIFGICPNGDSNEDNSLDSSCLDDSTGCDTETIGLLVPWNRSSDEISMFNMMGKSSNQDKRWITADSFTHLKTNFVSSSFVPSPLVLLVSGEIYKNGTAFIDSYSYVLNSQSFVNESSSGNYTLLLNTSNGILYSKSFDPSFFIIDIDGNVSESNISTFSFILPFNYNVTQLSLKNSSTIFNNVNRSTHIPQFISITNLSGVHLSNSPYELTWNVTDTDNDTLAYAALFSSDNGLNYTTLSMDFLDNQLIINSSILSDCSLCRIKIIASDGVNTNETISESFSIDNDLSIVNLNIIYQNNTERIIKFDINNTFTSNSITNISWNLNTGQTLIDSNTSLNFSLSSSELMSVFVYHNYTGAGNYSVVATAYNSQFTERRVLSIII